MPTLTLNDEERALLLEMLGNRVKELSHEIHKTDTHAFRDILVRQLGTIEQLVANLRKS